MTKKKPWNRINQPVYSISSKGLKKENMHLISYATAISMKPKRFVCGVYHGTQTLENLKHSGEFVLQLLAKEQVNLVNLLGKRSGKAVDKIKRLEKRKELSAWKEYKVLKSCLAVMRMKVINQINAGDHDALLCDVTDYQNLNEGEALTLDHLREKKLIRI